jgi:hypothetical protein
LAHRLEPAHVEPRGLLSGPFSVDPVGHSVLEPSRRKPFALFSRDDHRLNARVQSLDEIINRKFVHAVEQLKDQKSPRSDVFQDESPSALGAAPVCGGESCAPTATTGSSTGTSVLDEGLGAEAAPISAKVPQL